MTREALTRAITEYDHKQETKAAKNPRAYHNHYALAQYLARVDDIMADIEAGADTENAIIAGFTPGPLRTACLKACGFAKSTTESHGSYKGMPVYRPVQAR